MCCILLCTSFLFSSQPPEILVGAIIFSTGATPDPKSLPFCLTRILLLEFFNILPPLACSTGWNPRMACPLQICLCRSSSLKFSRTARTRYITKPSPFIVLAFSSYEMCTRPTPFHALILPCWLQLIFSFPKQIIGLNVSFCTFPNKAKLIKAYSSVLRAAFRFRTKENTLSSHGSFICLDKISTTTFFY